MNNWIYILVMAATTFAIRVIPLTLIRKEITSRFIKSFLYYVPYVTLSVMTFPAILEATENPYAGLVAFIGGLVAAWKKLPMAVVAVICCSIVLVFECII